MITANPKHGRYFTASAILRGKISSSEAERACLSIEDKMSSYFVEWIPNNVYCSLCDVPSVGESTSGVLIGNSYSMSWMLKWLSEDFSALFRKKAFLHWYTAVGMEEM